MGEGKGEDALALITGTFAKLDPDESIEISRDDALALGRGLGLNKNSLQSLADNFGRYDALRVTGEQFGNLMKPASMQFATDKANREKLDAALEQTLKPIISKARDRMEKEKAASALQNRKVEQSRILIDKTVQEQSREILNQTLQSGQQADDSPDAAEIASQSASANTYKSRNAASEAVPGVGAARVETAESGKNGSGSDAPAFENNSGQGKSKEWSELLGKVETRATAPQANTGNSIVFSMLQGGQRLSEADPIQSNAAEDQTLSRQVAQQVERGLLSALKDGGTRLDLQLHPQELGAITLTLTARNGEVSARIRSEKSETAEMVTRQLDTIRANLEQQGIKVDKIEVQLQSQQGDDGRQWQNLDQHNSRQEEDARREELARLKNLATLRNSGENMQPEILEQPVHSLTQTARYATQSLHVVA